MSTTISDDAPSAPAELSAEAGSRAGGRGWETTGVLLAVAVAIAAWVPFLNAPLTSDESGFLLLAQHWHHGSSLYGNYWVDRPPLLMWMFSVAGHLGSTSTTAFGVTAPGVKLLGATASGATVLLTGVLARLVAPRASRSRLAAVVLAVALLSNPLFGMPETDGEVLAVPFVLLGLVCLIAALRRRYGPSAVVLAAAAGASAVAAALVKQNVVDVFVFAVVLVVVSRGRVSRLRMRLAGFAGGAAAVLGAAVAGAWMQGTSMVGLWNAIVVFRFQASEVIGSSASEATPQRMDQMILAFAGSGAALVLIVAVVTVLSRVVRERRAVIPGALGVHESATGMAWPVAAMVAWELCGVALGGSYWLHYLTGLIPGLVMLLVIAHPGVWPRRVLSLVVAYTVVASLAVWVQHVAATTRVSSDALVMSYLRAHARATDGVVVGFGHPDIVLGSGLTSPYEQLWSLPVRVRDPRLEELQQVMAGPAAPQWIVVAGDSLDTWGIEAGQAQQYLQQHYVEQVTYGDWHIWQREEGRPR